MSPLNPLSRLFARRSADLLALRQQATTLSSRAARRFSDLEVATTHATAHVDALPDVDDNAIHQIRGEYQHVLARAETAMAAWATHRETWTDATIAKSTLATATTAVRDCEVVLDTLMSALLRVESLSTSTAPLKHSAT